MLGGSSVGVAGLRRSVSLAASRVRADFTFAVVDVFVVVSSYVMGLALRMLDPLIGGAQEFWEDLFIVLPVFVAVHILANALAGAYGHVWEHASTSEAMRVVVANAASSVVILCVNWGVRSAYDVVVPYSSVVLGGLLSVILMGLVRFRSRLFSFRKWGEGPRILVVGDGFDAASFARRAPEVTGGRVVGFLVESPDATAFTRRLADLPILGCVDEVAGVVAEHDIGQVVVVGNSPDRVRRVVDHCLDNDVRLRILPVPGDVLLADEAPLDVRDIRVEDLLVRDPVATDLSKVHEMLRGRSVLVTGGGGSIGSEIVRQVLEFEPRSVWVLDRDETLLHDARLRWSGPTNVVLADVRDARAMIRALERIRPEVVFHAAALKHVPVLEDHPEEAAMVNVVGTRNLIEAGSRVGMKHFVLISTDKAVDPSSVMGATKRVAEFLVKAGNERRDGCVYTAVRFGNVLGSRGSVIPTFISQIKAGGPVTVTHPDMTRYFMTVDEAVQLVLQASAMARGSEICLLDMGEPVRIQDLARRLIRLAGLTPDRDIEIRFTGRRPGEKLSESLANGPLRPTSHTQVFEVDLEYPAGPILVEWVAELEEAAQAGDRDRVVALLGALTGGRLKGDTPMSDPTEHLTPSWA